MSRIRHVLLLAALSIAVLATTACVYHHRRAERSREVVTYRHIPPPPPAVNQPAHLHRPQQNARAEMAGTHTWSTHDDNNEAEASRNDGDVVRANPAAEGDGADGVRGRGTVALERVEDPHELKLLEIPGAARPMQPLPLVIGGHTYVGTVVAVSEDSGAGVVDVGAQDGVEPNTWLSVRDPESGRFVAKAVITEVLETSTIIHSDSSSRVRPIRVGDKVHLTRIVQLEEWLDDTDGASPRELENERATTQAEPESVVRTLTKQNLIDMATAGISESNIRLLIERSRIPFEITSEVVIELKRVGLSEDLIEALILRIDRQSRN